MGFTIFDGDTMFIVGEWEERRAATKTGETIGQERKACTTPRSEPRRGALREQDGTERRARAKG